MQGPGAGTSSTLPLGSVSSVTMRSRNRGEFPELEVASLRGESQLAARWPPGREAEAPMPEAARERSTPAAGWPAGQSTATGWAGWLAGHGELAS